MIGFIEQQSNWYKEKSKRFDYIKLEIYKERIRRGIPITNVERICDAFKQLGQAFSKFGRSCYE